MTMFDLDHITLFGLLCLTSTVIFDSLEKRNRWFVLLFGLGCVGASYYGFVTGSWPFGLVEGIWAAIKFVHFYTDPRSLRFGTGWWQVGC